MRKLQKAEQDAAKEEKLQKLRIQISSPNKTKSEVQGHEKPWYLVFGFRQELSDENDRQTTLLAC